MKTLSSAWKSLRSRWLAQGCLLVGLLLAASCSSETQQSSGEGCKAPSQSCSGACVNVSVDPTNCGSCGMACRAGETCQAGRCTLTCMAPQIDCGGFCADPSSNALHCGGCGRPCASDQICQNSACVTGSCQAGQALCNGACVSTATDALNCGTCAHACLVGQTCQAGVCSGGSGTGGTGAGGGAGASTGGSAGASTSGSAGMSTGGTGGTSTGGSGGMSTGGMGGTPAGGGTGGRGGAGAGGRGGGGGTATGVGQSTTCPNITWPTASGSRNLGAGMSVSGVFDGGMNTIEGSLEDCTTGNQDTVDPIIEVANGGTVRNVVMGRRIGDGIHCLGSCTIENVWFPYICDDAITIDGSGTATIRNSGFKNARDKTIQHNGTATVTIDNVYVETAGKLYRSCGEGCSSSTRRSATLSNIVAIGVDEIAGVSTNDTVTLRNICMYRSFSVCSMYEPGTSTETENGVNQSNEGPSANCVFTANDTHALLSRVQGIPFTTQTMCGGPNGYKSGSTGTSCVSGFDKCLKSCAPGGYGFKEITCNGGLYQEGTGTICATPTDTTAAQNIAGSRVMSVTTPRVSNNGECSPEWATAVESSNTTNKCVCVHKPGYYSHDNWLAWDCQTRWW